MFGTSDNRSTTITGPVIVSTIAPPQPIYEDDPTKPVGTVVQTDTAHYGAKVYFKRLVTKDGQTLIDETVWSNYIPWPARFLKGTKTN
ncbi:G5 domain-containing protein [Candidatus Microgenomates bacterium]|nr:G5 domain-containing protein [Candidatus Microgenomates bacterium]